LNGPAFTVMIGLAQQHLVPLCDLGQVELVHHFRCVLWCSLEFEFAQSVLDCMQHVELLLHCVRGSVHE